MLQKKGGEGSGKEHSLRKEEEEDCFSFVQDSLEAETKCVVKVKAEIQGKESEWSNEIKFVPSEFSECCVWKKCPGNVDEWRKYSVDEKNPRIAAKINSGDYCTIIGNTPLPHNKVTSWSIKILKSKDNDGRGINVGVAPSNINQNEDNGNKCGWYFYCHDSELYSGSPHSYNFEKCGWYFDCCSSTLYAGPPHNYNFEKCGWYFYCYDSKLCSGLPHSYLGKEYGPRKGYGQYVHTEDTVGVVMDTAKGELSFVLNGVNLGVAYKEIPLDKPLVPCVFLCLEGDSVELII